MHSDLSTHLATWIPICSNPRYALCITPSKTLSVRRLKTMVSSLASCVNFVQDQKIPLTVRPVLFGASLLALKKKGGGVRPIAVGVITLCRLTATGLSHKQLFLHHRTQPGPLHFWSGRKTVIQHLRPPSLFTNRKHAGSLW